MEFMDAIQAGPLVLEGGLATTLEERDVDQRTWVGRAPAASSPDLLAADLVGGCRGASPRDIAALAAVR